MPKLRVGDFVRVRDDAEFRGGQDAMVMAPQDDEGTVGLLFAYDRRGDRVLTEGPFAKGPAPCSGIEAWHVDELDQDSLYRTGGHSA